MHEHPEKLMRGCTSDTTLTILVVSRVQLVSLVILSSEIKLENEKDYFKIGIDQGGKRAIEGLLPESLCTEVWHNNPGLVQKTLSDNKDESKSAKSELKKLYLQEFQSKAKPGNEYYQEFYKLTAKLNKALKK